MIELVTLRQIKRKMLLTSKVADHILPELKLISPDYIYYNNMSNMDEGKLCSFAVIVLTEALENGKIMLVKKD